MSDTKTTPTPEIVMSSDRYAGDDVHSVSCLIKFGPIYRAIIMQHMGQCGPEILEGRDELARLIVRSVNAREPMLNALIRAKNKMSIRGWACSMDSEAVETFNEVLRAIKAAESEDGLGGQ